jgi:hypothetical protein
MGAYLVCLSGVGWVVVGVFASAPASQGCSRKGGGGFGGVVVFLCGLCCLLVVFLLCVSLVLFLAGRGCVVCVGCFRFCQQASEARALAQANVVSAGGCWWSSVVKCLSRLVQAPRLVATPRLPADAARLTHLYNCCDDCRPLAYRPQRFLVCACVQAGDRSPFPVTLRLRC